MQRNVRIRDFRPDDAAALAQLFHLSVHIVGAKDYSSAQVHVWSPAPQSAEQFLQRASDGRRVFVAIANDDAPCGFIELEADGHIDCFYCHPAFVGKGAGSMLYEALETDAINAGHQTLRVEASEGAKRFFTHKGFTIIARQNFERSGVWIHNYRMIKNLAAAPRR